jgi:hypothetical protein
MTTVAATQARGVTLVAGVGQEMERAMGIEPTLSGWEPEVLPLNYARVAGRILWARPTAQQLAAARTHRGAPTGKAPATFGHATAPCCTGRDFYATRSVRFRPVGRCTRTPGVADATGDGGPEQGIALRCPPDVHRAHTARSAAAVTHGFSRCFALKREGGKADCGLEYYCIAIRSNRTDWCKQLFVVAVFDYASGIRLHNRLASAASTQPG